MSGTNLQMSIDGKQGCYGFEVARFVDSIDAESASAEALDLVRSSRQLTTVLNREHDPPDFWVEEVQMLEPGKAAPEKQPGFAFYPCGVKE